MPEIASRFFDLWRDFELRGVLFLINIGLPILVGVLRGETSAALIGGITGLLLSLADTEGPLGGRLRLTLMVAAGIVAGGALGTWLNLVRPIFWVAFFLAVFAAGLLNQLGKGPHFALRFGAISLAVVASLPEIVPQEYAYFAGTVLLCLLSRSVDHFLNGPLAFSGPWHVLVRSVGLAPLCARLCPVSDSRAVDRDRIGKHPGGVDLGDNARTHGA